MSEAVWLEIIALCSVVIKSIFDFIDKKIERKKNEIGKLNTKMDAMTEKLDADCRGTKMILARDIKQICRQALKDQAISLEDFELCEEEFEAYTELKGNGKIKQLWEKTKTLPIKGGKNVSSNNTNNNN